jgi:transcription elongation factor Elf1
MEGTQSALGYYPKCPHCGKDDGYSVTPCPHTTGIGGFVELVSCKNCKTLVNVLYPPERAFEE